MNVNEMVRWCKPMTGVVVVIKQHQEWTTEKTKNLVYLSSFKDPPSDDVCLHGEYR